MSGVLVAFCEILMTLAVFRQIPSDELGEALLAMLKTPEFRDEICILQDTRPELFDRLYGAFMEFIKDKEIKPK